MSSYLPNSLAEEGQLFGLCGSPVTGGQERSVTDTEADEMEEHLRCLGYLE